MRVYVLSRAERTDTSPPEGSRLRGPRSATRARAVLQRPVPGRQRCHAVGAAVAGVAHLGSEAAPRDGVHARGRYDDAPPRLRLLVPVPWHRRAEPRRPRPAARYGAARDANARGPRPRAQPVRAHAAVDADDACFLSIARSTATA